MISTTNLWALIYPLIRSCPIAQKIFPRESLISTIRKLPTLESFMSEEQNNRRKDGLTTNIMLGLNIYLAIWRLIVPNSIDIWWAQIS